MLAVVACLGLPHLGACSRTSDGTVVMMKPPTIPLPTPDWGFWKKKQPEQPAYVAAPFPSAPAQTTPPAPKRAHKSKPLFRSPLMTLDGKGDLKCESVKEPKNGRVSVVCK